VAAEPYTFYIALDVNQCNSAPFTDSYPMTIASGQSSVSYMNYTSRASDCGQGSCMEETSYFTGLLLHLLNYLGLLFVAHLLQRAPAVVTKEYEWSLGGITEDTYVTLTYTNPDGTTGGLSDYYGALGSQYIFCARQHSYSEPWYHNLNGRMPRSTCTCTSTSTST
jgi:hypothetical protein